MFIEHTTLSNMLWNKMCLHGSKLEITSFSIRDNDTVPLPGPRKLNLNRRIKIFRVDKIMIDIVTNDNTERRTTTSLIRRCLREVKLSHMYQVHKIVSHPNFTENWHATFVWTVTDQVRLRSKINSYWSLVLTHLSKRPTKTKATQSAWSPRIPH